MTINNPHVNQENQIDLNHNGVFPFDNIMSALQTSLDNGNYDVNNINCHLSIIKLIATLELSIEQSNWIIGQVLDGINPVTILNGFIIRFIPTIHFPASENVNTTISLNHARITLENAYTNYTYDRNSIAIILQELIELPIPEYHLTWITNQIISLINPTQIMMWFLESFIINPTNNQQNNSIHVEYNQITITRIPGTQPLNPLTNFNQMPVWFRSTLLVNVVRSTGIDYHQVNDLFNQHDNIFGVINCIINDYLINDLNILVSYRDRNTNRQHTWSFRMN